MFYSVSTRHFPSNICLLVKQNEIFEQKRGTNKIALLNKLGHRTFCVIACVYRLKDASEAHDICVRRIYSLRALYIELRGRLPWCCGCGWVRPSVTQNHVGLFHILYRTPRLGSTLTIRDPAEVNLHKIILSKLSS